MNKLGNRLWSNKSNTKLVLPPALLVICNLFLFGPTTIYSGNISEFNINLIDILKYYAIPGLILLLIFVGIGIALSRRYLSLYVALIFGVGILMWLQGNILVWDYGVFGKGDIEWTKDAWRGWVDGSLWIVLLILAGIFNKQTSRVATLACTLLISLQIMMLIYTGIQKPEIWKKKPVITAAAPKEIFEFSTKQNIIHVILDEFQSTVFREIIDEDSEYYKTALDGFTFFEETTGSFPTTIMSFPAIFSGKIYRNDVPIDQFIGGVFTGKTILNALYDGGYEIDFAAPPGGYLKGRYSNYYNIPVPYGVTKKQYIRANSGLMLNLVLFRSLPHFLKKKVHNAQGYLPSMNIRKQDVTHIEGARHFAHKAFLQDLIDNISVSRPKSVYKLIHLTTTHYPAVLNNDCKYAGDILPWRWENIKIQAKCSFDHFLRFLDSLKSLGIYDRALIILQADHGYWKIPNSIHELELRNLEKRVEGSFHGDDKYFAKVVSASLPLLAIKPPDTKGPLKISTALAMLTDIPATISSILNLPEKFNGRSVFQIGQNETRERRYFYYDDLNREGEKYFGRLDEYIIRGSSLDKASWRFVSILPSPEGPFQGKKIDFGTREALPFLRSGWSFKEMEPVSGLTYNWAMGKSASLFLRLPKDKRVVMTGSVKTLKFGRPQTITVKVDGNEIGTWELSPSSWDWSQPWKWEKHSIVIGPDESRPDLSVIEFNFSQYKRAGRDPRQLAVLFELITLCDPKTQEPGTEP